MTDFLGKIIGVINWDGLMLHVVRLKKTRLMWGKL